MPNMNILNALQRKFVCEHCGACCQIGGQVLITENDKANMLEYLKTYCKEPIDILVDVVSEDPNLYKLHDTAPCSLYDKESRLCKVHGGKPLSCRKYPFLYLAQKDACLQDIFVCRGAMRALADFLGVRLLGVDQK